MSLKNKYFAIIYKGCLDGETARKIHKKLYDATINTKPQYADKFLLGMMIKLSNKAKKLKEKDEDALAVALFSLFHDSKMNDKAKKLINHDTSKIAEQKKDDLIEQFVDKNREEGKWFYLASSHADCAEDHIPYQGRLYVDEKAPEEVIQYAKTRNLYTVQWVMGNPAWFITRPNCRHYFVSLTEKDVRKKSLDKLKKKYKTHRKEGNREFQTPKHAAIQEYEDRLHMLRSLYREHPTEILKNQILKTEMLLNKWKNPS